MRRRRSWGALSAKSSRVSGWWFPTRLRPARCRFWAQWAGPPSTSSSWIISSGSRMRTLRCAVWNVPMAVPISRNGTPNWLCQNPMRSPDLAPPEKKARLSRAAIAGGSVEERRRALRRARAFATSLLVLMLAIFIATSVGMKEWPWLAYVRAFAEAGMIGACADWFAVVALFRHPLGIPIPHTAIVPQNKQRIGGAIGRFISNNFLSPKVLTAKIREIDPVGWGAHWLLDTDTASRIAQRVATSLPQILRAMPRDELNAFLARAARSGIEAVPAAPLASKILSVL